MYIRHPFDVTMHYMVEDLISDHYEHEHTLKDVCEGGLCFYSPVPVEIGARIHIRIPIREPAFEAEGVVTWCKQTDRYEIGVQFDDESIDYNLRMVEQTCHIKHYMRREQKNGRQLSANEAAKEWITKYAAEFPALSGD
jgi:hypothetical protein